MKLGFFSVVAASMFVLAACQQDPRGEVATGTVSQTAAEMRCHPYTGETPPTVSGARTVDAAEVRRMLANGPAPILVDVAGGDERRSIPGAVWLPGAGSCDREQPRMQARFKAKMAELSGGDTARPVIVFCPSRTCWLSHNGAIRLARAGYTDVAWFRDGTEGWARAGGRLVSVPRGW